MTYFPPPAVALPLILLHLDNLGREIEPRLTPLQREALNGIADDLRYLLVSVELAGHTEWALQRITDLADGSAA